MKRAVSLFIILILAAVSAVSLAACRNRDPNEGKPTHIEIYAYEAGYGTQWIKASAEAFKNHYPEATFKIWVDDLFQQTHLMAAGPKTNKVSLFITGREGGNTFAKQGKAVNKDYDCVVEPLDDLYGWDLGGGATFKDRILDDYIPDKVSGHYYEVPWAHGMSGLLYNKTAFDRIGISAPRTTQELSELCTVIKSNDAKYENGSAVSKVPFVFSATTGYWEFLRNQWWLQYEGTEALTDFSNGVVRIDGQPVVSNQIFAQTGRLKALEALENLIFQTKGNNHINVNSLKYTQAQSRMIIGEGLMQPNGDWFENEMRNVADEDTNKFDIRMMRTPVISAIIEKCDNTVQDENKLRAVVDAVDADNRAAVADVSDSAYEIIQNARKVNSGVNTLQMYIPVYATAKDMAKEFLKFLVSDEACKIFVGTTNGNQNPYKFDLKADAETWNTLSNFAKDCYEYKQDSIFFQNYFKPLFPVDPFRRNNTETYFTAGNSHDRFTAKELFDEEREYYTVRVFNQMLKDAGVI